MSSRFFCEIFRACIHRKYMRIFEQIFLQTRQKFAGILSYGKNFSRSMQQNLPKRRRGCLKNSDVWKNAQKLLYVRRESAGRLSP
ncbi:hypothetical protein, partial [Ruminococcus sp.]|uniref:hypothetical protein n=1 Tax=Ruminococcus sp. TaxID=41978 RepID=UPI002E79AD67